MIDWAAFTVDLRAHFKSQTECARLTNLHHMSVHRAWNQQGIRTRSLLILCRYMAVNPTKYLVDRTD